MLRAEIKKGPGARARAPREKKRWKKSIKSDQTSCLLRSFPLIYGWVGGNGDRGGSKSIPWIPRVSPLKAWDKLTMEGYLKISWGLGGTEVRLPSLFASLRHFRLCGRSAGSEETSQRTRSMVRGSILWTEKREPGVDHTQARTRVLIHPRGRRSLRG